MHRWSGRVALVTGASVGIGAATAETLVKAGMTVIGCARNVQQIQDLSEKLEKETGKLHAVKCDLTKEEEILSMFETIRREHGRLDFCINNAGLCHAAPILSGTTEQWKNMFEVNVLGLCICTREAVKLMTEKGLDDGHIVLVNSVAGHYVTPLNDFHFYTATKFAVTALCEGIRHELRQIKSNMRVSEISPGIVETEFFPRCLGKETTNELFTSLGIKPLQSQDIAGMIEYVLAAPPNVQIHDIIVRPREEEF